MLQHAIERIERPGGSHEGVGREKNNHTHQNKKGQCDQLVSSPLVTWWRVTALYHSWSQADETGKWDVGPLACFLHGHDLKKNVQDEIYNLVVIFSSVVADLTLRLKDLQPGRKEHPDFGVAWKLTFMEDSFPSMFRARQCMLDCAMMQCRECIARWLPLMWQTCLPLRWKKVPNAHILEEHQPIEGKVNVKKRRAQICGQIQRFIKISTELRRQTRTSTTHTKQAQRV